MSILDFDPTEYDVSIKMVEENEGTEFLKTAMNRTFEAIMFLGNSISKADVMTKELSIFNIRLCYVYFMKHEDYYRLNKIKDLASLIEKDSNNIVDQSVIDDICINPN